MGAIQGAINQVAGSLGTVAAVSQHLAGQQNIEAGQKDVATKLTEAKSAMEFTNLQSARTFQAADKSLLEEVVKQRSNLLRNKPMLEKAGKWTEGHKNQLAQYETRIKELEGSIAGVETVLDAARGKLAKGTTTSLGD